MGDAGLAGHLAAATGTGACRQGHGGRQHGELVGGEGRHLRNFLYIFVDTFSGGGTVLDSRLHPGAHGNAGAIGSMPLAVPGAGTASTRRCWARPRC